MLNIQMSEVIRWRDCQIFRPARCASARYPSRLSEYSTSFDIPETTYRVCKHAVLVKAGTIGIHQSTVIQETVPFQFDFSQLKKDLEQSPTVGMSFSGVMCSLVDSRDFHNNYFHWFFDILPRVLASRNYESLCGLPVTYLVPERLSEWQAASLHAIGVTRERMLSRDLLCGNNLAVESLVSASSHRFVAAKGLPYDVISPADLLELRELTLDVFQFAGQVRTRRRLFINRTTAQSRRAILTGEVSSYLEKLNFQQIDLDGLTLLDQISLFQSSEIIIAVHGSALTNVMFSQPGTNVVEIFSSDHGIRPDYFQICSALGFDYSFIVCNAINNCGDVLVTKSQLEGVLEPVSHEVLSMQ